MTKNMEKHKVKEEMLRIYGGTKLRGMSEIDKRGLSAPYSLS